MPNLLTGWARRKLIEGKKFAGSGAGEGSRGGVVIGHTKSGKAIYASGSAPKASGADPTHAAAKGLEEARRTKPKGDAAIAKARTKMNEKADEHVAKHHADFTEDDHKEAADLHTKRAAEIRDRAKGSDNPAFHESRAIAHDIIGNAHAIKASKAPAAAGAKTTADKLGVGDHIKVRSGHKAHVLKVEHGGARVKYEDGKEEFIHGSDGPMEVLKKGK